MVLVLEIVAGIVLGGMALMALAIWTREIVTGLGLAALATVALVILAVEPGSLLLIVPGGIWLYLHMRKSEQRCEREQEELRKEIEADERERQATQAAGQDAAQNIHRWLSGRSDITQAQSPR